MRKVIYGAAFVVFMLAFLSCLIAAAFGHRTLAAASLAVGLAAWVVGRFTYPQDRGLNGEPPHKEDTPCPE